LPKINQPPIKMTATITTPINVFIWLLMSSDPPSRCAGKTYAALALPVCASAVNR
jgi:hypothetical protein